MSQMFHMEMKDLRWLHKFYRRMPKAFSRATAGTLSSFAFGSRKASLNIIRNRLTIRSPRFIEGSIRVVKARPGQPLNAQHSILGSVIRPRFTGLREQELGVSDKRKNIPTIAARRGQKKRKVPGPVRLKRINQFQSPDDFAGKTAAHRVISMLQSLERKGSRKPFIIKGHRRFKRGLYRFKARALVMLQSFEPKGKAPKRVRWLTGGRRKFITPTNIKTIWTKNLVHAVRVARRR